MTTYYKVALSNKNKFGKGGGVGYSRVKRLSLGMCGCVSLPLVRFEHFP